MTAQAVYQVIKERPGCTAYDIARALRCTTARVLSDLATLESEGVLLCEHPCYTSLYPFERVGDWRDVLLDEAEIRALAGALT